MRDEIHAYRVSDEFAAALREREQESARFTREVVVPFDEAHPDHRSLWTRGFGVDRRCVGFTDGTDEVPAGLSRSQRREELTPKRGKAGDEWRKAKDDLNRGPKIGPVFRKFGTDEYVMGPGRMCLPGIADTSVGMFMTWSITPERHSEHLTPVLLSEYYAAVEKADRERAS